MEAKKGLIAKSISGHDKDSLFVLVDILGKYALIANGKTRKLEKPKRKSLKHLKITNINNSDGIEANFTTVVDFTNLTNKSLRSIIRKTAGERD